MASCTPGGRFRTLVPVGSARSFRRHRSHMDEWARTGCRPTSVARRASLSATAHSLMRNYFVFRAMKIDQPPRGANRELGEKLGTRMWTFVFLPEGDSGGDAMQERLMPTASARCARSTQTNAREAPAAVGYRPESHRADESR